jgi:energy-coupling factor transporter ATP-binding protein EcfA2
MPNVISQIAEWGTSQPYWEQSALEKIITGAPFSEETYEELLQYLLEDASLADKKSKRNQLRLSEYIVPPGSAVAGKTILRQISNLENINALVSNQNVEFGDYLTVLFGDNGSGKSGYARVIASAAFTRGDKDILRDIRKPLDEASQLSADMILQVGESQTIPVHHIVGTPCPEMRSFYVFDSTSVRAHLTKPNVMSFSPAGLDILTKLVDVTDEVRKKLTQLIECKQIANIYEPLFWGETEVSKEIKNLSSETDESVIRRLGNITDEEIERIQALDRQIAELKIIDFPKEIETVNQTIEDLKTLATTLETLYQTLGDAEVTAIKGSVSRWQEQSTLAAQLSVDTFKVEGLSRVGSPIWYEFMRWALKLSTEESEKGPYPQNEAVCLLCHQPLSSEAHDHIHKIWKLLENDTQKNIAEVEDKFNSNQQTLAGINFDFFNDQTVSHRFLKTEYPSQFEVVNKFIAACKKRQNQLNETISKKMPIDVISLPDNGAAELWQLVGMLDAARGTIEERQQRAESDICRFKDELSSLEHRNQLHTILNEVLAFIQNEKWIKQASSLKVKGTTAHITKKYNTLFSELVTDKYLTLFIQTLKDLQCPMDVEIDYSGAKGETYKRITLKTNDLFPHELASPDKVLSEGEQRAVALADFFTEIALDDHSSGFILDDPVTSLDFRWKETIARNIVEQAKQKQVIVFTHDLHFLHCLKERADENSVGIRAHWIQKRDGIPGYVYIDNSPMAEKDYRAANQAKSFYDKAIAEGVSAEDQQYYLEKGFGALRTSYEAFIMYELFGGVVLRFEERISGDRLKDIYIDEQIRNQVIDNIGRISRYIDAHLHSDIQGAQKPTPELLDIEITGFMTLKESLKELKKKHFTTN